MTTGQETTAPLLPASARLFVAQLSGNAGFFIAVLLLARLLGPSGRGTVAFVTVSCLVLARICSLGLQDASTYFAAREPHRRGSVLVNLWLFTLCSTSVIGLLVVVALATTGVAPASVGTVELVILLVGTVVAGFVDGGIAYLYGVSRFATAALITAFTPWLYVLLLVAIAAADAMSATVALIAWLVTHLAWALALLAGAVRTTRPGRPDVALLTTSLRFGVRAWLGTMAKFANFRADQLMLGLLASEAVLGTYAVAVNSSEVLLYLPAAVAAVLVPSVASGTVSRAPDVLRAFRVVSIVTLLATVVAILVGPTLIPLVFGSDYAGSVTPFVVLSLGAFGYTASAIFSGGLLGSSHPGLASVGPVTSLVLGLTLDVILIPDYGATGAAWAATIAFAAGGVAATLAFRRVHPTPWRDLVPTRVDLAGVMAQVRQAGGRSRALLPTLAVAADGRLALQPGAYYWVRARFERARIALSRRREQRDPSVRILAYHRITDDDDVLAVKPAAFRAQLELALERGLTPIALDDAVGLLRRTLVPQERYFVVTFDDGYLDNLENALPILEELRVPATIFLPTDIISRRRAYHWYQSPPPAMTWDDAREALASGLVAFQAHGKTHLALPRLSDQALRWELHASRREIEQELGVSVTVFCYPAGLHGSREATAVRRAGYLAAVTTTPGLNHPGDADQYRLHRTTVAWSDTRYTFERKLDGALDSLSTLESWVRGRRSRSLPGRAPASGGTPAVRDRV